MPMLGDILAAARNSAGSFQSWLMASDPDLGARIVTAAAPLGMSLSGYARMAVADFSRFASEEDWATLISSLRDNDDPGTVCLLAMVHWRLAASGCGAHSHAIQRQDGEGAPDDRFRTAQA